MELSLVERFLALAHTHPGWLLACAALFAYLDAVAVFGLLLPGSILMFLIGAAASGDGLLLLWCWLSASTGALASDWTSYRLGRARRERVAFWPFLRRHPELLERARDQVTRHGGKGLFISRMIGPLRPLAPLVAGSMGLPARTLLVSMVPGALLWALLYLLPGVLFGASLELAAEFAGRLVFLLIVLVLGLWLLAWLTRSLYGFLAVRGNRWLKFLIRWSGRHPLLGRLLEPMFGAGTRRRELFTIAFLGFLLVACLTVLLGVLLIAPFAVRTLDAERQLASTALGLRSHLADPFMVGLALIGQVPALLLFSALLTLALLLLGRRQAASHWLVATAGAWLLALALSGLLRWLFVPVQAAGPAALIPHPGLALLVAVLGFFAILLARDLRTQQQKWPYLISTVLLALVSFAHFYLGLVSLLGLVGGLALGAGWAALVGIAHRQRSHARRHPMVLALLFASLFVLVWAAQLPAGHARLLEAVQRPLEQQPMSWSVWQEQEGWRQLLLAHAQGRRAHHAGQRFDLQYAGELGWLEDHLQAAGWQQPLRAADYSQLFTTRPDAARLPHLPRDVAGRPEAFILVKPREDGRHEVLRLWETGVRLEPGGWPVWLGQLRIEEVGSMFGLINRWRDAGQREAARARLRETLAGHLQQPDEAGPYLLTRPGFGPED